MKVTVLIDNTASSSLIEEWGLSFHIRFEGKRDRIGAWGRKGF